MRITHVYMEIGDGWAYPGKDLHISERVLVHLEGAEYYKAGRELKDYHCKTTAPRIAADEQPPIMVPMPEYDFDLDDPESENGELRLFLDMRAGKHIPERYEVLCAVYPYYSKEAAARGSAKANSPEIRARAVETRRKNKIGFFAPKVQAMGSAKSIEKQRKNGTGVFDPEVRAKGLDTNRNTGFQNLRIGLHTRWHVNRGIVNPDCNLCPAPPAQ